MWLLIVVPQGVDRVKAYVPDATWYDYETVSDVAAWPSHPPQAEGGSKAAAWGAWGSTIVRAFSFSSLWVLFCAEGLPKCAMKSLESLASADGKFHYVHLPITQL